MAHWNLVNKVIFESDILIMVLDARHPELSRNHEIEKKILKQNKKIIYVLNKSDLAKHIFFDKKLSINVSAKHHKGTMKLLRILSRISKGEKVVVGVLGYPNTGKSSVINALKGKSSAGVSSISGYTKAIQAVRVTKNIKLLDTPGVFPKKKHDEIVHALIGAKDVQKMKDPELVALELIDLLPEIKEKYSVEGDDCEEVLEKISEKLNFLGKGGKPDTIRAAKKIIFDIQNN